MKAGPARARLLIRGFHGSLRVRRVIVTMVRVGKVFVGVLQRLMMVWMPMLRPGGDILVMVVEVMGIMLVFMVMIDRGMRVRMDVMLGEAKPDAQRHERRRESQRPCRMFAEQQHR